MKIAPILAQFLYTKGKLDLQGIGSFHLENPSALQLIDTKNKPTQLEGVSFVPNKNIKEDSELVAYISSQTGKIKPLASADIESHLELAKQFLNIGKPFLFEGIGTVSKIGNDYHFSSGLIIAEPVKATTVKEAVSHQHNEEATGYDSVFYNKSKTTNNVWKKPAFAFLALVGLALAIWGGYTLYKNSSNKNETENTEIVNSNSTATIDTSSNAVKDTANKTSTKPIAITPTGSYKYILEQSDSLKAYARLNRLKKFGWNIDIEKADSSSYKLFMFLPGTVADTSRLTDSLRRLTGKRVYIQQ